MTTNQTTNQTANGTTNESTRGDDDGRAPVLVLGGAGKTGRRVAERLAERGVPVRIASRSATPSFDWHDPATWDAALAGGARAAYLAYAPDISVPGAAEAVRAVAERARAHGVGRLVLLSARMEAALPAEDAVQEVAKEWTILRCGWFAQNFSEEMIRDLVLSGQLALPTGQQAEPFLDAEDIADVAVAALLDDTGRHASRVYELSGSRALTVAEAAAEIARATGRELRYVPVSPEEFRQGMVAMGVPADLAEMVATIFAETFDGVDVAPTDGVRQALGREARDFSDYVRRAAAEGAWDA
ncbi:NmrA family NAD(P)-binding protein [Streptomyces sp. 4N509B]|uniref:NmrA family NAD(P)-binding protein n=1 Tax=Streptomyces sp. 4N509B TaxID=3457413 RepID=UPI003FD387AD